MCLEFCDRKADISLALLLHLDTSGSSDCIIRRLSSHHTGNRALGVSPYNYPMAKGRLEKTVTAIRER